MCGSRPLVLGHRPDTPVQWKVKVPSEWLAELCHAGKTFFLRKEMPCIMVGNFFFSLGFGLSGNWHQQRKGFHLQWVWLASAMWEQSGHWVQDIDEGLWLLRMAHGAAGVHSVIRSFPQEVPGESGSACSISEVAKREQHSYTHPAQGVHPGYLWQLSHHLIGAVATKPLRE